MPQAQLGDQRQSIDSEMALFDLNPRPRISQRGVRHRVKVMIVSARHLRAADFSLRGPGKSDPYCVCQVEGRPCTKFQTPSIDKSLDPEWYHEEVIDGIAPGDALEFRVYDHDLVGSDDLLGKAILPFDSYHPEGFSGNLDLEESGKGNMDSTLNVVVQVLPVLAEEHSDTRAFVKIVRAEGLLAADLGGKSDPYCVCWIPGKDGASFQTKVLYSNLAPEWNEEHELRGYATGDHIEFSVLDYDELSRDDSLGSCRLDSSQFHPEGYVGAVPLYDKEKTTKAQLFIEIDIIAPPVAKRVDPGLHVGPHWRQPVPFQLCSLETGRVHRLLGFTRVGRSSTQLDPAADLTFGDAGNSDISRVHAVIKAWCDDTLNNWQVRVYDEKGGAGYALGPGGGHAGGGTSVDGEPVDAEVGSALEVGGVVRFGINEFWTLSTASMHLRRKEGAKASSHASALAAEDPTTIRELKVPSIACHNTLKDCRNWISLVEVLLEWLGEADEPACADSIEVQDETGRPISRHDAVTLQEQKSYDVQLVLNDVRLGTTLRLRLSSDPYLLAPVLEHLDERMKQVQDTILGLDSLPG